MKGLRTGVAVGLLCATSVAWATVSPVAPSAFDFSKAPAEGAVVKQRRKRSLFRRAAKLGYDHVTVGGSLAFPMRSRGVRIPYDDYLVSERGQASGAAANLGTYILRLKWKW